MQQTARYTEQSEFIQYSFVVKSKNKGAYMLLGDIGLIKAVRAAGCLLEPEPGDVVLAAVSINSGVYITTVLERQAENIEAQLSLPDHTRLKADSELCIISDEIQAAGRKNISINTTNFNLHAVAAKARFEVCSLLGQRLDAKLAHVKSLAGRIDSTAERMVQRLTRSYRRISDFEDSRIGRWRCLVKKMFSLHSQETSLKADKQVKIDADKIALG